MTASHRLVAVNLTGELERERTGWNGAANVTSHHPGQYSKVDLTIPLAVCPEQAAWMMNLNAEQGFKALGDLGKVVCPEIPGRGDLVVGSNPTTGSGLCLF